MSDYQRKTLAPLADVGSPAPLPQDLFGLTDASLADVEAAIGTPAATQLGYLNTGFFPVVVPAPIPPQAVTQVQYRLAADDLGHLADLTDAATNLGGDHLIRWQTQVVLQPTDQWLIDIAITEAGLTQAEYDAIFAAALAQQDTLRNLLI